MAENVSSRILIPVEKQSLFILAFEDVLINSFKMIPFFEEGETNKNKCEVKFAYAQNNPSLSIELESNKAMQFLKENWHILGDDMNIEKKEPASSTVTSGMIDLVDDELQSWEPAALPIPEVDLTGPDELEGTVIVEDTMSELDVAMNRLQSTLNSMDDFFLDPIDEEYDISKPFKVKNKKSEIESLCVKREHDNKFPNFSPCDNQVKILERNTKLKKNNVKSDRNSSGHLCVTFNSNTNAKSSVSSSLEPVSSISKNNKNSGKTKNRLQNKSNIQSSNFKSCVSPDCRPLSGGVLSYYTNIAKNVNALSKESKDKNNPLQNILMNNKKLYRKSVTPKAKRLNKKKTQKNKIKLNRDIVQRSLTQKDQMIPLQIQNNLTPENKSNQIKTLTTRTETNIFNPNPVVLDNEGLRPIAIDGCNVAIGHGKGHFSVKGLKICVDFFARRGHKEIKLFLPQFRKNEFSNELLEALETKCDMVFTPSRNINGIIKSSYDDRFIVQYAVEFEGVIVSMDNYRDLLHENPRWRETIHQRLLMFTWVDDFLMFPVDPLGRHGPTLNEFLRF